MPRANLSRKTITDRIGRVGISTAPSIDRLPDAEEKPVAGLPRGQRFAIHGRGSRQLAQVG